MTRGWNFNYTLQFRRLLNSFQNTGCRFLNGLETDLTEGEYFKITDYSQYIRSFQLVGKSREDFLDFGFPLSDH